MNESGADGTRRSAWRLARFPPGSGASVKWIRPRVWNMLTPGRLVDATPEIGRGTAKAAKGMKKPPPRSGDERCQARGTTPLRGRSVSNHLYPHGTMVCDAATR
jgi:hypothetical protein